MPFYKQPVGNIFYLKKNYLDDSNIIGKMS